MRNLKPYNSYSPTNSLGRRSSRFVPWVALAAFLALTGVVRGQAAVDGQPPRDGQNEPPPALLIDVALPITDAIEKSVVRRVERAVGRLKSAKAVARRPVLVLEFLTTEQAGSENSSFGDALDLARFLSGEQLAGVQTVAWLPRTVKGHAVLPVLACERLVMAKDAELGAAGINEKPPLENAMRTAYLEYAARHSTVPPAVASALLDKDLAVFKVTSLDNSGIRYETEDDLKKLRERGVVSKEETFLEPGAHHLLSGAKLRECSQFTQLATSRREMAAALQLPWAALATDLVPEEGWKPLRIDLSGPVHKQAVNWILNSLEDHRRRGDFNLLVLAMNTGGGDLTESMRLAEHLANLDDNIRTVAFVNQDALSDAAIVALACDEMVMHPQGKLGGPGEGKNLGDADVALVRESVRALFARQGRDWSLPLALVDPQLVVHRYTNPLVGEIRYLSAEEAATVPNIDQWQDGGPLDTTGGLSAADAESMGLTRAIADSIGDVKTMYSLEGPLESARPNWVLAVVEWLATPQIASLLLFIGGFALLFELSTPGATVPGFIALLCFLLFFWSKFLHGTADWLEIMLFVGGLVCLGIELFALPGFGIFGFGGALMLIASVVLASQTFVLPTNPYQLRQFPVSLLMMAAGMAGGVVSVMVIRRFLPDTPYFNRVVLKPPRADELQELSRREALVTWDHLQNKRGIAMTPLVPAGKVQFGDDLVDCISNGELIAKGTPVAVEEVAGNRVVVRKINP